VSNRFSRRQAKSCFPLPFVAVLMAATMAFSAAPPAQRSHGRRKSARPIRPEGVAVRWLNGQDFSGLYT